MDAKAIGDKKATDMSYRQWLVGQALQGLCAGLLVHQDAVPRLAAAQAVAFADTTLQQLARVRP